MHSSADLTSSRPPAADYKKSDLTYREIRKLKVKYSTNLVLDIVVDMCDWMVYFIDHWPARDK